MTAVCGRWRVLCRTLRVSDDSLASRALLVPFVTCSHCSVPAHSCLVLSKHQDLAVATEPMQERLLLQPGRYSVEVINLDCAAGSKRTAKVLFALELPGCSPEATTQEVVTGESVVLRLEVPVLARTGASRAGVPHAARAAGAQQHRGQGVVEDASSGADGGCAKVRVMVQWKDDYQLAFAVRLVVRLELPDLELSRSHSFLAPASCWHLACARLASRMPWCAAGPQLGVLLGHKLYTRCSSHASARAMPRPHGAIAMPVPVCDMTSITSL